jgi:hypothetical protein
LRYEQSGGIIDCRAVSVCGGHEFGAVGTYERLVGRAHFAVDPHAPAQQGITDIDKAPVDAEGLVRFTGDFSILKPADPARCNRRIFFDYGNRGNKRIAAGVRAPMVRAPLGTYCGWNLRARGFGHGAMHEFSGSYIPFSETVEERRMTGDPRRSVIELYPTAKLRSPRSRRPRDSWSRRG